MAAALNHVTATATLGDRFRRLPPFPDPARPPRQRPSTEAAS
ncbi:hypothetical protein ACGFYV_06335 [Streptomyces sp. NPDC048297]